VADAGRHETRIAYPPASTPRHAQRQVGQRADARRVQHANEPHGFQRSTGSAVSGCGSAIPLGLLILTEAAFASFRSDGLASVKVVAKFACARLVAMVEAVGPAARGLLRSLADHRTHMPMP
jgi:hypothetical protein